MLRSFAILFGVDREEGPNGDRNKQARKGGKARNMNEIRIPDSAVASAWNQENKRRLEAILEARDRLSMACDCCTFRDAKLGGCENRKCSVYRVQAACMDMVAKSKYGTRLDIDGWRENWNSRAEHYRDYFRVLEEKVMAEESAEAK